MGQGKYNNEAFIITRHNKNHAFFTALNFTCLSNDEETNLKDRVCFLLEYSNALNLGDSCTTVAKTFHRPNCKHTKKNNELLIIIII